MPSFKNIRFTLPLLFLVMIIIFLWHGLPDHPKNISSPLLSQAAPEFKLPHLSDNKEITSNDDFIGHVTLLNVWATWCHTCAEEHSFLLTLANSEELRMIGLNYKDNNESAKKWLAEKGNPYFYVAIDPSGETGTTWGVHSTPESFIIDKKGVIRYKHIGPMHAGVWEKTIKPLVIQLQNETL